MKNSLDSNLEDEMNKEGGPRRCAFIHVEIKSTSIDNWTTSLDDVLNREEVFHSFCKESEMVLVNRPIAGT